jgi:GT2 family glycosyltransferase
MKIAFICVNYNNSEITKAYIENVFGIKQDEDIDVVVVDNASASEDLNGLKKYVDNLRRKNLCLICSDKNSGYFRGLNMGLDSLNVGLYDYIVIGNNDLTFSESFLCTLKKKQFEHKVYVIAPNIIKEGRIHQNPHILSPPSSFERIYRRIYFTNYYVALCLQFICNLLRSVVRSEDRLGHEEEHEIFMGYGACYILTKSFFKNNNKLDAPVFLMGEERILTNQVLENGGIILYSPDLKVAHQDHTSISKMTSKKLYQYSKESYLYALKHFRYL